MTPDAPTWAEIERFLKIDGWTRLAAASRGGSSQDHIFYEKLLDAGELLQTHISHSATKHPSSGRFAAILRDQLKVSREDFWRALRDRVPVLDAECAIGQLLVVGSLGAGRQALGTAFLSAVDLAAL